MSHGGRCAREYHGRARAVTCARFAVGVAPVGTFFEWRPAPTGDNSRCCPVDRALALAPDFRQSQRQQRSDTQCSNAREDRSQGPRLQPAHQSPSTSATPGSPATAERPPFLAARAVESAVRPSMLSRRPPARAAAQKPPRRYRSRPLSGHRTRCLGYWYASEGRFGSSPCGSRIQELAGSKWLRDGCFAIALRVGHEYRTGRGRSSTTATKAVKPARWLHARSE